MLDFGFERTTDTALEAKPIPAPSVRPINMEDTYGTIIVEPLERGFGDTLGTPMRRVLLGAIQGTAVTWVKIEGVSHEYSTIPHVKEDVLDILLNVKAIHLRALRDRPGKLRLEVQGEGRVCAGDIMTSPDFEIVNPELHLATLDGPDAKLIMEMNVEHGRGYVPATRGDGLPIGVLPVDAIFSPVRKVNYWVEQTRVGQRTDFDRLHIELWTNGAITPMEAVRQAAQELVEHFFRFSSFSETPSADGDKPAWVSAIPASQYNLPVENLNLSARTLNCLKRASIHKLGEVLEKSWEELLRIRNFGEKSLDELRDKLDELGIQHPGLSEQPKKAEPSIEADEPLDIGTAVEAENEDAANDEAKEE